MATVASSPHPLRAHLVLLLALLWLLAVLSLGVALLTLSARMEGQPAWFATTLPWAVTGLVGWLYGLIRQL